MATMTEADQAALELSMQIARKDRDRAEQLDYMLQDEPWQSVAAFASYCCQGKALNLNPWQMPPCWITNPDDPNDPANVPHGAKRDDGRHEAARLCRELRALGLSQYHPDPVAAIEEAKRRP